MIARREGSRESFRQIYRAMLTAGAADRDSQVVAVVARVVRKPAGDEVIDVAVHTLDFRNGLEEFDHGGVFPWSPGDVGNKIPVCGSGKPTGVAIVFGKLLARDATALCRGASRWFLRIGNAGAWMPRP